MTKRTFLIHGWKGYPKEGWRPWLRDKLKERGFQVFVPAMPDSANPKMETWVPYLTKIVGTADKECYFVGHSLGCIAILRYLETLTETQKVGGAVFVAGFGKDLEYEGYNGELFSFFTTPIDWKKVKKRCKKFISIHSDDDKWVSIKNSDLFKQKLNAETIIAHNMKHFSGDDGVNELPLALDAILKLAKD